MFSKTKNQQNSKKFILLTSGLIFTLGFSPLAQAIMGSSTNYQLDSADFSNGGGSGSSTNYNLDAAVIGDNMDGSIISHNYQICSGLVQETFATCDDPAPPAPPEPPEPPEPPAPPVVNNPPASGAGGEYGDDPIGNYPSDPSDPETPTDPVNPTDPQNPSEPTQPTQPTNPDQPSTPAEPPFPTTTTEPIRPVAPQFPDSPIEIIGEFTSNAQAIIDFLSNPQNLINPPQTLESIILSNQNNLILITLIPAITFLLPINNFYTDLIWPNVFFNNNICYTQPRCFIDLIQMNNAIYAPLDTTIYNLSNWDALLILVLTSSLAILTASFYLYRRNGFSQTISLIPVAKAKKRSKKLSRKAK